MEDPVGLTCTHVTRLVCRPRTRSGVVEGEGAVTSHTSNRLSSWPENKKRPLCVQRGGHVVHDGEGGWSWGGGQQGSRNTHSSAAPQHQTARRTLACTCMPMAIHAQRMRASTWTDSHTHKCTHACRQRPWGQQRTSEKSSVGTPHTISGEWNWDNM